MSVLVSRIALQRSSGLDETGPVVWHLALCLLLSSIIVAAALIRGIKSSGKVSPPQLKSEAHCNNPQSFLHRFGIGMLCAGTDPVKKSKTEFKSLKTWNF